MPHTGRHHGRHELYDPVGGMIWYIIGSTLMGLGGLIFYAYYHKKGQFKGMEDVKYQIFHEEE